jgi:hypothetical protein
MKTQEIKIKDGTIIEFDKSLKLSSSDKRRLENCKNKEETAEIIGELTAKKIIENEFKKIKPIEIKIKF